MEVDQLNESGRVQIRNIHTAGMRQSNLLAGDLHITELANKTKDFTGADLLGPSDTVLCHKPYPQVQ